MRMMDSLYEIITLIGEPFSSPFYLLFLLLVILFSRKRSGFMRFLLLVLFTVVFYGVYKTVSYNKEAAVWLSRLKSPVFLVMSVVVVPALLLPRNKWYRMFLVFVVLWVVLLPLEVVHQYSRMPSDAEFSWFLARSVFVLGAVGGVFVLAAHLLSLGNLRKLVRITMFLILIYGGLALRQDHTDYKEAMSRRKESTTRVLLLAETVPVIRGDRQMIYLPSAPCRFSADGGYVQGCPMELLQRIAQTDYGKVIEGGVGETSLLAVLLAALVSLIILSFVGARLWCGWVCPLSTAGDVIDSVRRFFRLPHLKPAQPLKTGYLFSGISFASFGLFLAKTYPHLDTEGRFLGCKIPVYPFCKICPGQQICPVLSQGPQGYPPLPTSDWLFGFFKYGAIALLVLFLLSFALGRRLWCRFCPMGMIGGLFNRGGMLALKKDVRKCNHCGVCNEVCPMDIHVVAEEKEQEDVSSFECVYCLKCVDKCPRNGCLHIEFAGKKVAESHFSS